MDIAVILAGGRGSRMKRKTNKVLEKVCEKPIILHIIDVLRAKNLKIYVVIGNNGQEIKNILGDSVEYVFQEEALGTGDALRCACKQIKEKPEHILVLNGDGPIVESSILEEMLAGDFDLKLLTATRGCRSSFGRILRNNNQIAGIIEAKDCTSEQLKIAEVNLGLYCFKYDVLCRYVTKLSRNNAQNEYYVTDLVKILYNHNFKINSINADSYFVLNGVNTVMELNIAEHKMRAYIHKNLAEKGVRLIDNNVYIDIYSHIGNGCTIYPNVYIKNSILGENVSVFPNCFLKNVVVKSGVTIGANCVLSGINVDKNVMHSTTRLNIEK